MRWMRRKKSNGLQNVTQTADPDEGEISVPLKFRVLVFCRHQDLPHLSKPIQKKLENNPITAKITARKIHILEERTDEMTVNSRQNGKEVKL